MGSVDAIFSLFYALLVYRESNSLPLQSRKHLTELKLIQEDCIPAQSCPTSQSQILEQYITAPDVSDRSDVNTLEEDESLPQKKKTKLDDHLLSNDQSIGETSLSAVPQLPMRKPSK